jgi:hypothetical protein
VIIGAFECNGDRYRLHETEATPEQSDDEAVPDSITLYLLEVDGAVVFSSSKLSSVMVELNRYLIQAEGRTLRVG